MKPNFTWGKVIGDPADEGKIKANIEDHLNDPLIFTVPEDGVVNVSIYSGNPPFFKLMAMVSDSAGNELLHLSLRDDGSISSI